MKYGFIVLEIQDGEHGYYSHSVVTFEEGTIEEQAQYCAETWYEGEDFEITDDWVDFLYMAVMVKVHRAEEISKEHYDILKNYL